MNLDCKAAGAGWRSLSIHTKKQMAGRTDGDAFVAANEHWHALSFRSGDQSTRRSGHHRKAGIRVA